MANYQAFVDDYLRVVENDQDAWLRHIALANHANNQVYKLGDLLRDEFESKVSYSLDKIDPSHNDYYVNIIREMLLGWGCDPYESIAREVLARLDEGK